MCVMYILYVCLYVFFRFIFVSSHIIIYFIVGTTDFFKFNFVSNSDYFSFRSYRLVKRSRLYASRRTRVHHQLNFRIHYEYFNRSAFIIFSVWYNYNPVVNIFIHLHFIWLPREVYDCTIVLLKNMYLYSECFTTRSISLRQKNEGFVVSHFIGSETILLLLSIRQY